MKDGAAVERKGDLRQGVRRQLGDCDQNTRDGKGTSVDDEQFLLREAHGASARAREQSRRAPESAC